MQHADPTRAPSADVTARRRPRVGLIVPRSNTTCEAELQDFAKGEFSVHTARMKTVAGSLKGDPQAVALEGLVDPVEDLRLCRVDLVALGCTTAAMACDQEVLDRAMRFDGAVKVVLISQSILRALSDAGIRKVALLTPYTEASNTQLAQFLAPHGIEVTTAVGFKLNTSPANFALVSELTRDYLVSEAAAMDLCGAEALLISCTDLHSLDLLDEVSARIGVPVLSSNQAFFEDVARVLAA